MPAVALLGTGIRRPGAFVLTGLVAAAWLTALHMAASAQAHAVEKFYRGNSISLVVGSGPGGSHDLYARLLARHLGRHVPGNPSVVVQNTPGAGGLRAANYLYN